MNIKKDCRQKEKVLYLKEKKKKKICMKIKYNYTGKCNFP